MKTNSEKKLAEGLQMKYKILSLDPSMYDTKACLSHVCNISRKALLKTKFKFEYFVNSWKLIKIQRTARSIILQSSSWLFIFKIIARLQIGDVKSNRQQHNLHLKLICIFAIKRETLVFERIKNRK